ncbi:hypothetical protein ACLOAV_007435 [Pseudogymnoascus australis]
MVDTRFWYDISCVVIAGAFSLALSFGMVFAVFCISNFAWSDFQRCYLDVKELNHLRTLPVELTIRDARLAEAEECVKGLEAELAKLRQESRATSSSGTTTIKAVPKAQNWFSEQWALYSYLKRCFMDAPERHKYWQGLEKKLKAATAKSDEADAAIQEQSVRVGAVEAQIKKLEAQVASITGELESQLSRGKTEAMVAIDEHVQRTEQATKELEDFKQQFAVKMLEIEAYHSKNAREQAASYARTQTRLQDFQAIHDRTGSQISELKAQLMGMKGVQLMQTAKGLAQQPSDIKAEDRLQCREEPKLMREQENDLVSSFKVAEKTRETGVTVSEEVKRLEAEEKLAERLKAERELRQSYFAAAIQEEYDITSGIHSPQTATMTVTQSNLFAPLSLGNHTLQHRLALAPLTRFRTTDAHVPLPMVATYYAQRAAAPGTLLISEATYVSPAAVGYKHAPGIYNAAQIAAWKPVTEAVHARGGVIFSQLWALGRTADKEGAESEGQTVKAPSAIAVPGGPLPEALTEEEIQQYIRDYAQAARNAIEAGFDGVEVHNANGYLPHQFLEEVSNQRTDHWGGSVEKRSRFGIAVVKAVVEAVGAEKVGIRLSPYFKSYGMNVVDPTEQFTYFVNELKKFDIAYLHLVEGRFDGTKEERDSVRFLAEVWGKEKPLLIAGGFNAESAKEVVKEYEGFKLVVVFGRHFIANPDLVFRIRENVALTPYNRNTFYNAMQEEGYTDYPFSKEFLASGEAPLEIKSKA